MRRMCKSGGVRGQASGDVARAARPAEPAVVPALLVIAVLLIPLFAAAQNARIGKPATEAQISAVNLTVFPDGTGLPVGKGTAAKGRDLYKDKCAVCHNDKGEGRENQYPALVGGIGTIQTTKTVRTVGG